MTRQAKLSAVLALCALAAVLSGCGGNDSGYSKKSAGAAATQSTSTAAGVATISTADTKLGTILTGAGGKTVYLFEADKNGKSTCDDACASAWPPVITDGAPRTDGKAEDSKLGTTKRSDGNLQVTYGGWPLYYYVSDTKAGDVTGNDVDGFGAEWYALTPSGKAVEDSDHGDDD
ncbi:MAG: hypothetical protein QM648_06555 [Solirubrobacterales bacterium]